MTGSRQTGLDNTGQAKVGLMNNKKNFSYILLAVLLVCSLFISGCSAALSGSSSGQADTQVSAPTVSGEEPSGSSQASSSSEDSSAFSKLSDEIFKYMLTSNALDLHFQLSDPSAYGLKAEENDLGHIDIKYSSEETDKEKKWQSRLKAISRGRLSTDEQLTYDLLKEVISEDLDTDQESLYYYYEPLRTMSGVHSMLPIMMSEYEFNSKADVDEYITLLGCFPSYFQNILEYEQAKSAAGLFMSDACLDTVIKSCQSFISDPDNNTLSSTFSDRVKNVSGLSSSEISSLTKKNEEAVKNSVIPAYESLISGLQKLRGSGKNDKGLCYLDKGKEYYSLLARSDTGTDMTPDKMADLIETSMVSCINKIRGIYLADKNIYSKISGPFDIGTTDPAEMISMLQKAIKTDFPDGATEKYELKYVPAALESSTNPAFYVVPPIDKPDQNVIYLNNSSVGSNALELFKTLAHEGYPGHLYQHSYFAAQDPAPIRFTLSYDGYLEGWASYVENMSYSWAGLDEKVTQMLQLNDILTLDIYARADIGVNYDGWTQDELSDYLSDYGFSGDSAASEIFPLVVGTPGSYLPYCIGMLEFQKLEQKASDKAGKKFDIKSFHKYILDMGPCSFTVMEKYMKKDGII